MSLPPPGSDCVGRTIDGKFTLIRWLGGTAQGSVYFTELETSSPRNAALKLIPADAVDAEARIAQWTWARNLSHPNLMRIFACGRCEVDGKPYLYVVTEFAEEILSEILKDRPLTAAETREMLGPVLDGLSALHARDRIHGHLKPSNIMVVDDCLKLTVDRLHAYGEFGKPSVSTGKCDAPDVTTGIIAPATDVWALGVVLVETLTQRPPVWDKLTTGDPVVPPAVPRPFSALVRECLRVDPARRSTLSGVRAFLEGPQAAEPARRRTLTMPPRVRTWMLAGAALVVVVVIAAFVIGSHHTPPASAEVPQTLPPPPPAASQPQPLAPAPHAQPAANARAAVTYQTLPDVPQHIRDNIQGRIRVVIHVQVDPSGNVTDAAIDSPGPSRYFATHAQQAAREWKFRPPKVDGRAVASQWTLQFHFEQSGTTVTPTQTSP